MRQHASKKGSSVLQSVLGGSFQRGFSEGLSCNSVGGGRVLRRGSEKRLPAGYLEGRNTPCRRV